MTPNNPSPRTIEVIVSPDGAITVQTKGFTGATCRQASRLIEQALGTVQTDVPTAEFYQPATQHTAQEQRTG